MGGSARVAQGRRLGISADRFGRVMLLAVLVLIVLSASYAPGLQGLETAGLDLAARLAPEATLFHATEHLLLPVRGVPTVLTVHDLIFKLFPAYHKRLNYWYLNLAMPLFCRRATAIIAVSEATR